MNAARLDEQAAIQRAMKRMLQAGDTHKYLHAGVELALVEGVDKLRVRLRKDATDTASVGNGEGEDSQSDRPDQDLTEGDQIH